MALANLAARVVRNNFGPEIKHAFFSRQSYASACVTSTWIENGKNKPCGIEMPGMSTTHAQIYQSSSLGVSIPPHTLSSDTSNQISAPFTPACHKRKHADLEEGNDQIGLPFTIQVLRACCAFVRNRLTNKS